MGKAGDRNISGLYIVKGGENILKQQCSGVEIELTGITRKQAAEVLAELFGTTSQYTGGIYDAYTVKDQEGKEWKLMSDASIRPQKKEGKNLTTGTNYHRVEMVTPKLTYEEMEKLQKAVRCIRRAGGIVNDSCGLHVHIDGANHTQKSLKNLLSIMYAKEDILFRALQVNEQRAERWCQKVREPMLQQARQLASSETANLTRLEEIWYDGITASNRTSRQHYHPTRYHALNLHSMFYRGTVEFRMFNSTLHAGEVRAYVTLCLAMSAQAIAQRGTVLKKTQSDNEKFTFRTWLIRLGLNGEEFKAVRRHLLKNLEGDPSWRYAKSSYACNQRPRSMER